MKHHHPRRRPSHRLGLLGLSLLANQIPALKTSPLLGRHITDTQSIQRSIQIHTSLQFSPHSSSSVTSSSSKLSAAASSQKQKQPQKDAADILLELESPFSQLSDESDDRGLSPPLSTIYGRDLGMLEEVTAQFVEDEYLYPRGKLTEEDLETITGLMAAWARRRSVKAALKVEA